MKVIAGLGNPGRQYVGTRHNIGFEVLQLLASRHHADSWKSRFEAETTEFLLGSEKLYLLAPQTYMNLSGRSIAQVMGFFKTDPTDLILICDDMNLPVGQLRLRRGGSAGGQKGLQNTIDQLGTNEFPRLRFGVGRPPGRMNAADYVLQQFRKEELETVKVGIQLAADAVECWVTEGIDAAMNRFNVTATTDN